MSTQSGEILGVYKSLCCGAEIVIPTGAMLPKCPLHPTLPTVWRSVVDEKICHVAEPPDDENRKTDPAA